MRQSCSDGVQRVQTNIGYCNENASCPGRHTVCLPQMQELETEKKDSLQSEGVFECFVLLPAILTADLAVITVWWCLGIVRMQASLCFWSTWSRIMKLLERPVGSVYQRCHAMARSFQTIRTMQMWSNLPMART